MNASKAKGLYAYHFDPKHGHKDVIIDSNWKTGVKYTLKTEVHAGEMKVWYNSVLKYSGKVGGDINKDYKELYFKTGDYCQSFEDTDSHSDYCEVLIQDLNVVHK